jgi:hypothetical protein
MKVFVYLIDGVETLKINEDVSYEFLENDVDAYVVGFVENKSFSIESFYSKEKGKRHGVRILLFLCNYIKNYVIT